MLLLHPPARSQSSPSVPHLSKWHHPSSRSPTRSPLTSWIFPSHPQLNGLRNLCHATWSLLDPHSHIIFFGLLSCSAPQAPLLLSHPVLPSVLSSEQCIQNKYLTMLFSIFNGSSLPTEWSSFQLCEPKPRIPHLQNGDCPGCLPGPLWEVKEMMWMMWAHSWAHGNSQQWEEEMVVTERRRGAGFHCYYRGGKSLWSGPQSTFSALTFLPELQI